MVRHFEVKSLSDLLERVAEWPTPQVVHKRRGERLVYPSILRGDVFLDYFHQPPSGVENSHAMKQPRVGGSRIDEVRKPELLDAP